jgi:hypothetical protein
MIHDTVSYDNTPTYQISGLYQRVKELQPEKGCLSTNRIRRRKSPTKTICVPSFLRWKGEIICSSWTFKSVKTCCLNIQVSLKHAARVLHTLVRSSCTNKWPTISKNWQKGGRKISIGKCIQMRVTSSKCTKIL